MFIFRKVETCYFARLKGLLYRCFSSLYIFWAFFFFVNASSDSFKITKFLIQSILNCKWITACVTTTMSILNNKRTLIVCQLLLSTLAFGLFQVGRQDAGKMLSNMVLASLLSSRNIAITYMTDSIVCDFILSYFKCQGLLYSVAQVGNYSFIFRDVG